MSGDYHESPGEAYSYSDYIKEMQTQLSECGEAPDIPVLNALIEELMESLTIEHDEVAPTHIRDDYIKDVEEALKSLHKLAGLIQHARFPAKRYKYQLSVFRDAIKKCDLCYEPVIDKEGCPDNSVNPLQDGFEDRREWWYRKTPSVLEIFDKFQYPEYEEEIEEMDEDDEDWLQEDSTQDN